MRSLKREEIKIPAGAPENTSGKTLTNAFINHTSAARKEMYSLQLSNATIPINAEVPYADSSLAPDVFCRSSAVQVLKNTRIKVLGRFKYNLDTTIVYEEDGIIKSLMFHPFCYCAEWAVPNTTDLLDSRIPIGEDVGIEDYPFRLEAVNSYKPETEVFGYGINALSISSIDRKNEEDGTRISDEYLARNASIKYRDIDIYYDDIFIKGINGRLFPELGQLVEGDTLMTLLKNTKVNTLASIGESVLEDDVILAQPGSFISRLTVICNSPIPNEELEGYRLKFLDYRRDIHRFLSTLDKSKFCPLTAAMFENYASSTFVDKERDYSRPYIKFTMCRVDIPGIGSKFTTLAGGKFTVDEIYKAGKYKDEYGRNIDVILSSSSTIKRENYSTPYYEKHINAINLHLHQCAIDGSISPDGLYTVVRKIHELSGTFQIRNFDMLKATPADLYEYYRLFMPSYIDLPESSGLNVDSFAEIQDLLISMGIPRRDLVIYNDGKPLVEKHEVGHIFMFKLMNDVETGDQMSGYTELDTRGYPLDKSNSRLNGRSYWNVKPAKFSDLAVNVLVNSLKNVYVHILLNDNSNYSLGEYFAAIGGELTLTNNTSSSELRNTYDLEDDDTDDDAYLYSGCDYDE